MFDSGLITWFNEDGDNHFRLVSTFRDLTPNYTVSFQKAIHTIAARDFVIQQYSSFITRLQPVQFNVDNFVHQFNFSY